LLLSSLFAHLLFISLTRPPPTSTLFPYTTLFRSQTQPELSKYHTYDLLLLLSYLREQRSTAYKTMQSVRKAPNEVKTSRNDYDELNEYGQEFYREATARKNIIEQILIDRMGYY